MRRELKLGKHEATYDDGVFELRYDQDVEEHEARRLIELVGEYSTGAHSVWVVDVTRLGAFTPGARKALSAPPPGMTAADETHTHLFVVGATIKTKAVLSLVFAATRLMGNLRYHVEYVTALDGARRRAHAKLRELVDAGLAKLP